MNKLIRKLFFNGSKIKTFLVTRLKENEIEEKVFLKKGNYTLDITKTHGMICLDPFCIAAWISSGQENLFDPLTVQVQFKKASKLNASINLSLIEKIKTEKGCLLLYKIEKVKNYQLNPLHRLILFAYLLRSKKNTYYSRKVISSLYSYPRSIIVVSYKDSTYHNIFPMDIHSYIAQEGLYILGLRTTNVTLNKILESKKVVVCDTDQADINAIYNIGKHPSSSPTALESLPFNTTPSEVFGFPVPEFAGSYKEIEIIQNRAMGYHMLMIGKVVNSNIRKQNAASFYHVGFLQFQNGNYSSIEAVY